MKKILMAGTLFCMGMAASADVDSTIPTWCGSPEHSGIQICLMSSINNNSYIRERLGTIPGGQVDVIFHVGTIQSSITPNTPWVTKYSGFSAQCERSTDHCHEVKMDLTITVPTTPNPQKAVGEVVGSDINPPLKFEMTNTNLKFNK